MFTQHICINVMFLWLCSVLKECAEVFIILRDKNLLFLFGLITTARKVRHAKPVCAVSVLGGVKQTGKSTRAFFRYIRQWSNPAASFSEVRNAFQQIFIKKRQSGTPKSSQKWSVRPIQAPADCKSTYLFVSPTIKSTFLSAQFKRRTGGKLGKAQSLRRNTWCEGVRWLLVGAGCVLKRFTVEINLPGVWKAGKSRN